MQDGNHLPKTHGTCFGYKIWKHLHIHNEVACGWKPRLDTKFIYTSVVSYTLSLKMIPYGVPKHLMQAVDSLWLQQWPAAVLLCSIFCLGHDPSWELGIGFSACGNCWYPETLRCSLYHWPTLLIVASGGSFWISNFHIRGAYQLALTSQSSRKVKRISTSQGHWEPCKHCGSMGCAYVGKITVVHVVKCLS